MGRTRLTREAVGGDDRDDVRAAGRARDAREEVRHLEAAGRLILREGVQQAAVRGGRGGKG
jgi:hypothetical protein